MSRNSRLLSESVTAPPTNVAYTVGARASAASIPVSRNSAMEAPVSVPDTPSPLRASTDTLQCLSPASACTPAVVMQTGRDTVAGAQASVVSVPISHRSDPAVIQINDEMAQTSPAVPGLNNNVFPVLPQGNGVGPAAVLQVLRVARGWITNLRRMIGYQIGLITYNILKWWQPGMDELWKRRLYN